MDKAPSKHTPMPTESAKSVEDLRHWKGRTSGRGRGTLPGEIVTVGGEDRTVEPRERGKVAVFGFGRWGGATWGASEGAKLGPVRNPAGE
jgi:hypothetical protein